VEVAAPTAEEAADALAGSEDGTAA
jgi:hypothetical protein